MTREEGDDRERAGIGVHRAGAQDWWGSGRVLSGSDPAVPVRLSRTSAMRPGGYAPRSRRRISLRSLILVPFGAGMIFGSATVWISASVGPATVSVDGTDRAISQAYGVNGWESLAAGALLAGSGLGLVAWRIWVLKLLAFIGALAGLGIGVYSLIRILHDMSSAHTKIAQHSPLATQLLGSSSIGYGLIVVVVASLIGLLLTLTGTDRYS